MTAAQPPNKISNHDYTHAYAVLHHPYARYITSSRRRQSTRPWKSKATRKTSVDLTLDNAKHVRLRDIFDPPLHATEMPPINIKWQWEDQFDHLCLNAGWTPTTAVRNKIQRSP
jgi:hypothetical protein